MDKGAKDKLGGSPGENGRRIGWSKKIFTQKLEGMRQGRPRKGWRQEVERDLKVLGGEKMERVGDR